MWSNFSKPEIILSYKSTNVFFLDLLASISVGHKRGGLLAQLANLALHTFAT